MRTAIEQNEARFAHALKANDATTIAGFFTEDGLIIPGWQKGNVQGRAAIQAYYSKRFETAHFLDAVITTASIGTSGDLAYESGTNRLTRKTGDAAPVTTTGRYLTIWHRESDDHWRIQVDMVIVDPP
ncbi:MAG: YybH family protein [Myxococcaceae bacterium]